MQHLGTLQASDNGDALAGSSLLKKGPRLATQGLCEHIGRQPHDIFLARLAYGCSNVMNARDAPGGSYRNGLKLVGIFVENVLICTCRKNTGA